MTLEEKKRCFGSHNKLYAQYHDEEWAVPSYDDQYLFEMLILEGAQAGLNWETILKRREEYREAFHQFDVKEVSLMSDRELDYLIENGKIIRNKLKIYSTRQNAKVFIEIQKEFRSFSHYLWGFTQNKITYSRYRSYQEMPTQTDVSLAISKDLKKRGMKFVGPTIIYAYMQAVGMVNDHLIDCWKHQSN